MKITVLFFGATAAAIGKREITISVADGSTANAILENIIKQFPRLASHRLHISVNQQFAADNEIVLDGDELAIFTAVSGG